MTHMKIVTHPDNATSLKRAIDSGEKQFGRPSQFRLLPIEIISNPLCEKSRPSGRVVFRGRAMKKEEFSYKTRFITYGPEDLHYFLFTGEAVEEMEPFFYVIDDAMFQIRFDPLPFMHQPMAVIKNFTV